LKNDLYIYVKRPPAY